MGIRRPPDGSTQHPAVDPLDPPAGRQVAAGSAGKEDQVTDRNCCDGLCEQGRSCPYRSAVTPKHLLPGPKPDYSVEIAAVMAFVVILGGWALAWLWELWI
jgi:hypothetical protein